LFDKATVITSDEKFQQRGFDYNNICAAKASHQYCVRFAEAHGGVTEYKKKD
jgi:beta-1,2-mannosyltransferase